MVLINPLMGLTVANGVISADLIQLTQLILEVGLQTGAVVTLEGPQLIDLLLQKAPLVSERLKYLSPLLLGLGDHSGGTLARLGDHLLVPRCCLGDEGIVLGLS